MPLKKWNLKTVKIQKSSEIQRSFTTYKWGIKYMMFKTSCNLSYKKM
jgi:hypothetical protein